MMMMMMMMMVVVVVLVVVVVEVVVVVVSLLGGHIRYPLEDKEGHEGFVVEKHVDGVCRDRFARQTRDDYSHSSVGQGVHNWDHCWGATSHTIEKDNWLSFSSNCCVFLNETLRVL